MIRAFYEVTPLPAGSELPDPTELQQICEVDGPVDTSYCRSGRYALFQVQNEIVAVSQPFPQSNLRLREIRANPDSPSYAVGAYSEGVQYYPMAWKRTSELLPCTLTQRVKKRLNLNVAQLEVPLYTTAANLSRCGGVKNAGDALTSVREAENMLILGTRKVQVSLCESDEYHDSATCWVRELFYEQDQQRSKLVEVDLNTRISPDSGWHLSAVFCYRLIGTSLEIFGRGKFKHRWREFRLQPTES